MQCIVIDILKKRTVTIDQRTLYARENEDNYGWPLKLNANEKEFAILATKEMVQKIVCIHLFRAALSFQQRGILLSFSMFCPGSRSLPW